MILEILGIIHILHFPLLIVYPFIIINQIHDIYYITYFFFICFSYTFINGECPISFVSKIIKRNFPKNICENERNFPKNICENERNFPEMASILPTHLYPYIYYYFVITTKIYLFSLFLVIYRNKLYHIVFFPFCTLFIYFLFITKIITIRFLKFFILVQQFTKFTLLFTIYFLLENQCYLPFHSHLRH